MGFREIRSRVIQALEEGRVQHAARGEIDEKNLLLMGDVTLKQVVRLLNACRGTQYSSTPHHSVPEITVHIFKPELNLMPNLMSHSGSKNQHWYIKLYFIEPDVWFLSVHLSNRSK